MVNPLVNTGFRPHSKGSAESPYITLSQHTCVTDIYETY